jgi:hypothetical protein
MIYTPSDLIDDNLAFMAKDHLDHFNDVYEIRLNGTVESYTCPMGMVFENSKNRTHNVTCINWEWKPDFKIESPCMRKLVHTS